jgi:hypothetical protein
MAGPPHGRHGARRDIEALARVRLYGAASAMAHWGAAG